MTTHHADFAIPVTQGGAISGIESHEIFDHDQQAQIVEKAKAALKAYTAAILFGVLLTGCGLIGPPEEVKLVHILCTWVHDFDRFRTITQYDGTAEPNTRKAPLQLTISP